MAASDANAGLRWSEAEPEAGIGGIATSGTGGR